jgi:hypothetical protein
LRLYPVTHRNNSEGIGVTLTHGHLQCEASFHRYGVNSRYPEVCYIGSARRRLRMSRYTKEFRDFLDICDIAREGTKVVLKFNDRRVGVSGTR